MATPFADPKTTHPAWPTEPSLIASVLGASFAGVAVPTLLSVVFAGQSYAGASDERVTDLAENTYAPFFKHVIGRLAQLAAIEWAALAITLYAT